MRLETVLETLFRILGGGASGANQAVQRYLADKTYSNVLEHCMKVHCPNKSGNWPTRQRVGPQSVKGSTTPHSRTPPGRRQGKQSWLPMRSASPRQKCWRTLPAS